MTPYLLLTTCMLATLAAFAAATPLPQASSALEAEASHRQLFSGSSDGSNSGGTIASSDDSTSDDTTSDDSSSNDSSDDTTSTSDDGSSDTSSGNSGSTSSGASCGNNWYNCGGETSCSDGTSYCTGCGTSGMATAPGGVHSMCPGSSGSGCTLDQKCDNSAGCSGTGANGDVCCASCPSSLKCSGAGNNACDGTHYTQVKNTASTKQTAASASVVAAECAAVSEIECYYTPGCGWCLPASYNDESACVPGSKTGPWMPLPQLGGPLHDCNKTFNAGVQRTADTMCLIASGSDVVCYETCSDPLTLQEGLNQQMFIVPNEATCQQYSKMYTSQGSTGTTRQKVHQVVTAYIMKKAMINVHVKQLRAAGHTQLAEQAASSNSFKFSYDDGTPAVHKDATTALLASELTSMEGKGLEYLEDGACGMTAAFGPEGPVLCKALFDSPIGHFINGVIENCPIVKDITHDIAAMCTAILPKGLHNLANDAIGLYNDAKNAVEKVGSAIVDGAEDVGTDCLHGIEDVGSDIADAAGGFVSDIGHGLDDIWHDIV